MADTDPTIPAPPSPPPNSGDAPPDRPQLALLDLLADLADLPPADRAARLAAEPLSPADRAKLTTWLAAEDHPAGLLDRPPTVVRNAMWSPDASSNPTGTLAGHPGTLPTSGNTLGAHPPAGPRLGRPGALFANYRLIEFLAAGSFGEVWVAAHRSLDTAEAVPTCLKLLYPENSDLDDVLREARTMAAIRDANVVSVKLADRAPIDGVDVCFIEMELVGEADGANFQRARNLADAAVTADAQPTFSVAQSAAIAAGVCRGVHAAHVRGKLHRDLKPANVLLEPRSLRPKVTDFGIATPVGPGGVASRGASSRGLGTPAFMAPEQARGESTQSSDVYACGAILYFLLAGHAPYGPTEPTSMARPAWMQVLDQVKASAPPKPLPVVRRRIPRAVAAICAKAMHADPARRYASALAMADDLAAWREYRPTTAENAGALRKLALWYRRHLATATLGLIFALCAIVGLAWYVRAIGLEQQQTEAQRKIAVANAARAADNEQKALAGRRDAEARLAESYVFRGDTLTGSDRHAEARAMYRQAHDTYAALGETGFPADFAEALLNKTAPPPVIEFSELTTVPHPAFSPDGHTLAAGGGDGVIRLYDLRAGARLAREFRGHTGPVVGVAFTPDGQTLVSASWDKSVRTWPLAPPTTTAPSTAPAPPPPPPPPPPMIAPVLIREMALSPDGTRAVTGGNEKLLRVWDVKANRLVRTIPFPDSGVSAISFFRDNRRVAVANGKIWVVDTETAAIGPTIKARAHAVAISPDDKWIAGESEGPRDTLDIWDAATGYPLKSLPGGHRGQVSGLQFVGGDNNRLISCGYDRAVRLWDVTGRFRTRPFQGHAGWVVALAVSPDGRTFATGAMDPAAPMKLWDLTADVGVRRFSGNVHDVSPDGTCVALAGDNAAVTVRDLATGLPLLEYKTPFRGRPAGRGRMHFRGGPGTLLVGLDQSPDTEVWDVAAGRQLEPLKGLGQPAGVSPDGTVAAVRPGSVARRDVIDLGARRKLFDLPESYVAFAPNGQLLANWGEGATAVDLHDARTGAKTATLGPMAYYDKTVSFSADASRAVTASGERDARLWDTRTGQLLRTFRADGEGQSAATLSPDGRWVVTVGGEWTLRLWDAHTGRELRQAAPGMPAHLPRFTADGARLVVDAQGPFVLDFAHVARERALRPLLAAARQALAVNANDPAALAVVGQWYAHHGLPDRAVPLLEKARAANADFPPEALARCYWRLARGPEARAEFTKAATRAKTPAEKAYFELCAAAAAAGR